MASQIGGQAVIEGVLFLSEKKVALAVRKPNGSIHTESTKRIRWLPQLRKIPILRGIISFVEMIVLGTSYLNKSANIAISETLAPTQSSKKSPKTSSTKSSETIPVWMMVLGSLFGFAIAIGIFKFIPFFLSHLVFAPTAPALAFSSFEGFLKLCLLLSYLAIIGQFADVKRVFEYHGAEHKVIRCVEAGNKLTVGNVRTSSRLHPRCGTSFMIFVIAVSIILYSFISLSSSYPVQFATRLLLLPLVAGIAFEILRLTALIPEKSFFGFILWPGYGVQLLTTREPDAKEIEVAIASYKKVI